MWAIKTNRDPLPTHLAPESDTPSSPLRFQARRGFSICRPAGVGERLFHGFGGKLLAGSRLEAAN
jgi:hypothetical protein